MMAIFEKVMPTLHASLLAREYDQNLSRSCGCGSPEPTYRCHSCAHSPLRCKLCILNDHHHTPWHHIDGWVGTHFARTSLHHLGYRYRLGHGGGTCPNRGENSIVQSIVVVHSNGFHKTSVEFCACDQSTTSADQFLKTDLFPASFEHPETVFTFELLDMFEKLSLKSKMNAYDYHLSLQEMTNAAFPQEVPVRSDHILSLMKLIKAVNRIVITNSSASIVFGTIWLRYEDRDSATASMMLFPIVGKVQLLSDALPVQKSISTLI